ncbi:MAG: DUF4250 domain-containing protein [Paramuribaculum sp.]|nr:DUF4250 domain-containing protein [Paramuribaculum sp.]MDE6323971.1 DUF4250 domain-containing protein [Paramuribaculum sp.]MDE6489301.1 DUF4250 domain-containing protein [Paramuribaculum sp.]
MEQLPSDPVILLSFLNMKLRDDYLSPEELCNRLDIDKDKFDAYISERRICFDTKSGRFIID